MQAIEAALVAGERDRAVDVALSNGLFADALILAHTAPDRARFLDIVKDYCDRCVAYIA